MTPLERLRLAYTAFLATRGQFLPTSGESRLTALLEAVARYLEEVRT